MLIPINVLDLPFLEVTYYCITIHFTVNPASLKVICELGLSDFLGSMGTGTQVSSKGNMIYESYVELSVFPSSWRTDYRRLMYQKGVVRLI